VTVTGTGGVGKTRLTIEVAHRLQDVFDGGQFFISLDRVGTPEDAVHAVLDVLRHHCAPEARNVADIAAALGNARVLLLLNAAEVVVELHTGLIRLLENLPTVSVLVSSRVPLRVRGEQEYPICCLPMPEQDMSLKDLRSVPSVQIFLERVRSVRPSFELTEQNREDVIEVLQRLDGLPIAIELAALRSRLFPVRAILERMDTLLDFLSGGPHDLPPRLQSIRAVIQWGYDLLSPSDQRAFRALSVFENSFSFDAASAMLVDDAGEPLPTGAVMDSLTTLVDHSFITQVPVEGSDAGYRMPTTTREFGRELLVEYGEHEAARDRELAFYLAAFRKFEPEIYGPQQPALIARVDFFSSNLHTALRIARRDRARVENALRVARYLSPYWLLRGNAAVGIELLEAFLEMAENIQDAERAVSCRQLGALAIDMNRLDAAHAWHSRALALYEQLDDPDGIAESWNNLGVVAMRMGNIEEARELLGKAFEARKDGADQAALAQTLNDVGDLAMHEGDLSLAARRHEEAYRIHVELRNRLAIVGDCVNLLIGALLREEPQPRADWYQRGIRFAEDISDRNGKAQLQLVHGMLELRAGEAPGALQEIAGALEVIRDSGSARLMLEALPLLAEVCARLDDDRMAAQVFGAISHMSSGTDRFSWYRGKRQARALEREVHARLGDGEFTRFTMLGSHQSIGQTIDAVLELIGNEVRAGEVREITGQEQGSDEVVQLTGRELEVLDLVAQGMPDKEIAETLKISPRTAMTHVSNIIKKMGVHSRSAATEYGIRMGLVSPPRDGDL
jgi:predicted ATPase/DNA-binding CsgD family transcriptional regulator